MRDFLLRMPKGADLHLHLTGAAYAESHIAPPPRTVFAWTPSPSHSPSRSRSWRARSGSRSASRATCPLRSVHANQALYNGLIDFFSMRGFVPSEGVTGHDHFFESFTKFGGTDPRHLGEWLDEIAARAARQNVQYLEVMATPTWNRLNTITKDVAWREDFAALRQELLAKGLDR